VIFERNASRVSFLSRFATIPATPKTEADAVRKRLDAERISRRAVHVRSNQAQQQAHDDHADGFEERS
jgi:hypothetical protein